MKRRNKNKYKFSGSRVCETVVGKNISQIVKSKIKVLAISHFNSDTFKSSFQKSPLTLISNTLKEF